MQTNTWVRTTLALVLVRALTMTAYAQEGVAARGFTGFQNRIERAVGLNAEQKDAVRGLLAQQNQTLRSLRDDVNTKSAAIRQETDAKIRALLSPEQQKKFDTFLAKQKQSRPAKRSRPS